MHEKSPYILDHHSEGSHQKVADNQQVVIVLSIIKDSADSGELDERRVSKPVSPKHSSSQQRRIKSAPRESTKAIPRVLVVDSAALTVYLRIKNNISIATVQIRFPYYRLFFSIRYRGESEADDDAAKEVGYRGEYSRQWLHRCWSYIGGA